MQLKRLEIVRNKIRLKHDSIRTKDAFHTTKRILFL